MVTDVKKVPKASTFYVLDLASDCFGEALVQVQFRSDPNCVSRKLPWVMLETVVKCSYAVYLQLTSESQNAPMAKARTSSKL